jgi:hypothetical protein
LGDTRLISCARGKVLIPSVSQSDHSDHGNVIAFPIRTTRRGPDFQLWFPEAFARYLRASFERPEDVAAVYRVRMSTAWKWWNGESGASGHHVMRTVMSDPEALAFFMSDWQAVA